MNFLLHKIVFVKNNQIDFFDGNTAPLTKSSLPKKQKIRNNFFQIPVKPEKTKSRNAI